jgi:hypothetical protein
MRDRVLAVLLTLVVFATGFAAGMWGESHRPFPAPPGGFMGEYGPARAQGPRSAPINRAQLVEQIDAIRPQMDAFMARVIEIYGEFDRDMESVLTPQQLPIYDKKLKTQHAFGTPASIAASDQPLSDEQIDALLQRPFHTLAYFIVIPMTLERLTNELKLDDAQRGKVRDFLRVRREKFIELVDSSPPLSLALSRLAPIAKRLGGPGTPPDAPAH